MVAPKHRKVLLKRALDATAFRGVMPGATLLVASSEVEAREYRAAGIADERIVVRPHGFPEVERNAMPRSLRERVGLDESARVVLNVGRIAHGKGLELLVHIATQLPDVHVVIVGPDGGHGVDRRAARASRPARRHRRACTSSGRCRVRSCRPCTRTRTSSCCRRATRTSAWSRPRPRRPAPRSCSPTVAASRSASPGRGAIVVPYDEAQLREALERLLADPELRRRLGEEAREVAEEWSWPRVVALQEDVYRRALDSALEHA